MNTLRVCSLVGILAFIAASTIGADDAEAGESATQGSPSSSSSSPFDFVNPYLVASSDIVLTPTKDDFVATIHYKTTRGDRGTALWLSNESRRRIEFHPNGVFLFAVDFPIGDERVFPHVSSAPEALAQLPQFYYVFPQIRRIAELRGLIVAGASTAFGCDESYQKFGMCVEQCRDFVPGHYGAGCQDGIYGPEGCLFNQYCDAPDPCGACCADLFSCHGGGGGGGGGIFCRIDDIYCKAIFAGSSGSSHD